MEADVQDKYNALLEWIRSTDGSSFVGPIAPHQFADTGRGIIALQDLHAGQVTLKISARLLMHTGSAAQSPPLQAALQGLAMSEEQVGPHTVCNISNLHGMLRCWRCTFCTSCTLAQLPTGQPTSRCCPLVTPPCPASPPQPSPCSSFHMPWTPPIAASIPCSSHTLEWCQYSSALVRFELTSSTLAQLFDSQASKTPPCIDGHGRNLRALVELCTWKQAQLGHSLRWETCTTTAHHQHHTCLSLVC